MDTREQRAMEITGDVRITFAAGGWLVNSQTSSDKYAVNPSATAPSCACEDFQLRALPCKHILAVRLLLERQLRGDPNPAPEQIPPRAPRKTYRQDWPNYNLAQTNEKDHFQVLLADLCRPLPELPLKNAEKGGRPPLPIADAVFAAVFKVYSTFSARRFMSDLRGPRTRPRRTSGKLQRGSQVPGTAGRDSDPSRTHPAKFPAAAVSGNGLRARLQRVQHVAVREVVRPKIRLRPREVRVGQDAPDNGRQDERGHGRPHRRQELRRLSAFRAAGERHGGKLHDQGSLCGQGVSQ